MIIMLYYYYSFIYSGVNVYEIIFLWGHSGRSIPSAGRLPLWLWQFVCRHNDDLGPSPLGSGSGCKILGNSCPTRIDELFTQDPGLKTQEPESPRHSM